ncbi:dihydrofolate reductase family protein [Aeromicrobium sp. Leaf350]|uniref:dihydrofolate reductase family protein n=1 Tax=Aeromicrobium sp. Leaf350 TaxID=2876565 RepID=UPI001E3AA5D8|nr:dihydrofolate reductase family protein [Aeromicrobium sp. Leaf350]
MRVRADLNISLDGIAAPPVGTPEEPFGEDWGRLVAAYVATRTMQETVFDNAGAGTTGVDDAYARRYFEGTGAEIMGAHKFGLDLYGDDPDWQGWWGPNPPFHTPVFVLTHQERPSLEMEGGTTFHFISAPPREALRLASEAAAGRDVRIGGGPTVVQEYLRAGLVDELHVAIAPIVLNRGISLWDDLRGLDEGYDVRSEASESGTSHVTFTRKVTP